MRERTQKAIVVSLHKSGTNLVTRLVKSMGFTPIGAGVNDSYDYIFRKLHGHRQSPRFQTFLEDTHSVLTDSSALLDLCFIDSEPDTCVFLHSLNQERYSSDATNFDGVPIVFNYRDPRAVLVSFVYYLTDAARDEFTKISGYVELSEMLKRLPTLEERLTFVMKFVPNYLNGAFLDNAWLLREPNVVSVSYENLVGKRGGGSDDEQLTTVARLMNHLGVTGEASEIANALYDTSSRTFRKGSVASWRDEFTPTVAQTFNEKFAQLLEIYGYESAD